MFSLTSGEKTAVILSPGVTTGELMEFFLENDICFESDVILPTVTYGGVMSGGCHVCNINFYSWLYHSAKLFLLIHNCHS